MDMEGSKKDQDQLKSSMKLQLKPLKDWENFGIHQ